MEEPKVITIGDVMDLTVMHIKKGTHTERKGNAVTGLNSAEHRLLTCLKAV